MTGLGRRRALDAARLAVLYDDASGLLDRLLLRLIATFQETARRGMNPSVVLPALTSILALVFALALFDQWRERRGGFQLIWALGMVFYGVGAGCEAIGAASGWNETLYRTWYLTGAVWTAGWLGLGTAFLLGRTRFGYSFALCLFLAGLFTFLAPHEARIRRGRGAAAALLHRRRRPRARGRGRDLLRERALADAGRGGRRRGDDPEPRPDGDDDAGGARATRSTRRPAPRSRRCSRPSSGC